LTPTKQLCEQTAVVFEALSVGTTISCITRLKRDSKLNDQFDILICTPSQLVGYLSKFDQNIDQNISHLVIDEADRLLDDSNVNIMTELFSRLPIKVDKVDNGLLQIVYIYYVVI
jgi:superfamily II DNA/RNA helicase